VADCYPSRAQGMQADAASQPIRPAFFSPRRLAGLLLLVPLLVLPLWQPNGEWLLRRARGLPLTLLL